ncbi:hypothetical protein IQ576_004562 [Salmonella enterica]|nr:hypothetical protein [Salmonella enterica]
MPNVKIMLYGNFGGSGEQPHVDIARIWRQHNQEHADSSEENVFIAEGGNEYDGAKCWVVFQES